MIAEKSKREWHGCKIGDDICKKGSRSCVSESVKVCVQKLRDIASVADDGAYQ